MFTKWFNREQKWHICWRAQVNETSPVYYGDGVHTFTEKLTEQDIPNLRNILAESTCQAAGRGIDPKNITILSMTKLDA